MPKIALKLYIIIFFDWKSDSPPKENPKIPIPSQIFSSPAKKKMFPPPRQIIPEIFIPPQKFGVKWYYEHFFKSLYGLPNK